MGKALITGANSLVNKALLGRLSSMEYEVVAQYHSDNSVTKDIKEAYPKVTFVQADFTEQTSFESFYESVLAHAPFEVMVNAAAAYESGPDWQQRQQSWTSWETTFAANTIVPGLLMARCNRLMSTPGVVLNISSTVGQRQFGKAEFLMYSASKAALDSMTCTFAKQWSPNIRVIGIAPGYVRSAWNIDMPADDLNDVVKDHLTHRLVEPEEIADLMETVINNPGINATTLLIDGGYAAPII